MCLAPADEFGIEGARALGRMLLTNTSLLELDIGSNSLLELDIGIKLGSKFPCSSFVCASDWLCLLHVLDLV